GERRSEHGEIGPHHAVKNVLRQKFHHVFRREDGQRGNALAEAVVNQMRKIADVVGVGMGDENGLDSSLLCEGKFGGQRAGIDRTLIFAPTGSGKTLTAFLWCLDRLMFAPRPQKERRCRVVYISPLKALAVDVERNLRAPLGGIANIATARGDAFTVPSIAIRTGDTPSAERN